MPVKRIWETRLEPSPSMSTPIVSPSLIVLTFAVHTWHVGLPAVPGRHGPRRLRAGAGGPPRRARRARALPARVCGGGQRRRVGAEQDEEGGQAGEDADAERHG